MPNRGYNGRAQTPRAEVAKRQTQWTQNPPWATTWGFKSPPRHHRILLKFKHLARRGHPTRIARGGRNGRIVTVLSLFVPVISQRLFWRGQLKRPSSTPSRPDAVRRTPRS